MITLPTATLMRWSLENGRSIGVAAAFTLAVLLRVSGDPHLSLLEGLAIVLPAFEVVMFAAVVAFYLDTEADEDHDGTMAQDAEALIAWFVVVFIIIWGNIALVHAGIEAYVALGAPPSWDVAM